jgi:hypothetical protein
MATKDKRRPIEERIAALMGKTAYCDLRDGVGGTSPLQMRDSDIAAALGMVSSTKGPLPAMVLETHYGSTLVHKAKIARVWEDEERVPGEPREQTCLTRFGAELAIREFAGIRYGTPQLAEYAHLIVSRRESLHARVKACGQWLEGWRTAGLQELRRVLKDEDVMKELRKKRAA